MTIGAAVLIVFAFAVVTVGCGSDTTDDGASRCESVPELVAQYLDVVLLPGMTLEDAVAVRSADGDDRYMIAANVDGEAAVWFADADDVAGVVWSVNEHAVEVSEVAKPPDVAGSWSEDDMEAVEAARSCLP